MSRPSRAAPANAWRRGTFPVLCSGVGGLPTTNYVQGWQRGFFGMDRRRYFDNDDGIAFGWVVTHLPSGYVLRGIEGPLPLAKLIVDKLAKADWDFSDPEQARLRKDHVRRVMDSHPECVSSSGFWAPDFVDAPASAIEARSDETPQAAQPEGRERGGEAETPNLSPALAKAKGHG